MNKSERSRDHGLEIRLAVPSDIDGIVRVHEISFPEYFLTHLEAGFLRRYYAAYLAHEDGITSVALYNGRVCAFIVGTQRASNVLKTFYRSNLAYVCWATLKQVASLDPVVVKGLFVRLGHVKIACKAIFCRNNIRPTNQADVRKEDKGKVGRLVSIATSPECRGTKASIEMIRFFEEQLRHHGTGEVRLCVNADNARAIQFYKKAGWLVSEDRGDELVFIRRL